MVTGIDIGEGVIEAAKRLGPGITFQVGDAEALEFDDATLTASRPLLASCLLPDRRPQRGKSRGLHAKAAASLSQHGCRAAWLKSYSN